MYHVPLDFHCIYGCSDERGENGYEEEGKDRRLPGLLYADELVLCGESKEGLRAMVGCLVEVSRRRCLNVNAGKSWVMVLGEEDGLECEVLMNGMQLEHMLELKYLGCVLDKSGTDEAESFKKVMS